MEFQGSGRALSAEGLAAAAEVIGTRQAEIWTVLGVETVGVGFLSDRRPLILFERHVFSDRTGGRFDAIHPDISATRPGGYGPPGAAQHHRLTKAIALDRSAALESASWGIGQVMGHNARNLGYGSAAAMVAEMVESEDNQLLAMARFIACRPACRRALIAHDWATFARLYNGPGYARNRYDVRLAEQYKRCSSSAPPDLQVRAAQLYLTYHGHLPGPIDGLFGRMTQAALREFQDRSGLGVTGALDGQTVERLRA
jgi:Putative peptidoglycan binding domain./Protein of unknown function (DUF3380).